MGEGLQKYVQKNKQSYNDEAFTTAEQPINIVVVIGESYIKHHSWLYGYPLETTPHLSAEKDSGTSAVHQLSSHKSYFSLQVF